MTEQQKKQLIREALLARENSYSPYSGYRVGAALLAEDGRIFRGCNIENAAYTPTNCAERTAFFQAVAMGERRFLAIAVVGGKDGKPTGYTSPCGVCRQVMREFCDSETFQVILAIDESQWQKYLLKDLFPMSFGPENLG